MVLPFCCATSDVCVDIASKPGVCPLAIETEFGLVLVAIKFSESLLCVKLVKYWTISLFGIRDAIV